MSPRKKVKIGDSGLGQLLEDQRLMFLGDPLQPFRERIGTLIDPREDGTH